jgi:hypothetical protein
LAASSGTIRLALRSATEHESSADTKGITMSQLLRLGNGDQMLTAKSNSSFKDLFGFMTNASAQTPAPKKQVKDKPFAVEVIKGNSSERIYFASANSDLRVNPQAKDEDALKEKNAQANKTDLVAVPE